MLIQHLFFITGLILYLVITDWNGTVKAYNVYYPLTYPDNIDLTEIDDKRTRDAVVIQASHFGQCPHPVFHSAHLKKRPNLQMRRNLREMLLLSNPSSIYEQNQPAWIGKYCRIHAISDYDAEVMKACYGNLRYVLGSSSPRSIPIISSCFNLMAS